MTSVAGGDPVRYFRGGVSCGFNLLVYFLFGLVAVVMLIFILIL